MIKEWFTCPICGQKLLMVDKAQYIKGVYILCKKCKNEIEVKNEPEPEPTASYS
jgi:transcription elongation factor Elf1